MAKKKAVKKGKKKVGSTSKVAVKGHDKIVLMQKVAVVRVQVNNGEETSKQVPYGFTAYPPGVPLSSVRVHAHNTRNMQDYNSLKVAVELEDVTISNSRARAECTKRLIEEALDLTVEFTKEGAKRLFGVSLAENDV